MFKISQEVFSAIIGAIVALITSILVLLIEHRKRKAEIDHLLAETRKINIETEELRRRPIVVEKEKYSDLLKNFLHPFNDILIDNAGIYTALIGERGSLEYHPKVLANFFNSLPFDDRRNIYWFQRLERLRKNNRRILALIQQYGSSIITTYFRDACAEFRYHANEWEDLWKAVENYRIRLPDEKLLKEGEQIPDVAGEGDHRGNTLYANRFPSELRSALDKEIIEVQQRAESKI